MLESLKGIGYGGAAGNKLNMILQELQSTKQSVLAGTTAATAIALVGIDYLDTITSVIRYASGVPSDVTAEASIVDRRATGTLTLSGVVAGDTAIVNGKTYTAVAGNYAFARSGELPSRSFAVGASDSATAANLAAAINAYADSAVVASAAAAVVTITARSLPADAGAVTAQNAIALGNTTHFTRSAATLTGATLTQAIRLSTTNTTGNQLVVTWAKKPLAAV
jgi:hypothetical protein